ncbi:response regulator [bacterium]|nr:response regulator [bacterium]
MRVLVIDDDFHILRIVEDRLKAENFDVLKASDGIEGLRLVYDFHPDVILLDIMMPTIDGHAVLHCLKRDEKIKNIPVIMMTAKRERVDVVRAAEGGAADYIVKPIDFRQMVKKIYEMAHAVPPPPKESRGDINVKSMAADLANLSYEMEAVAQSAGVSVPRSVVRSNAFKVDAELNGNVAVLRLMGPIQNGDVEQVKNEIKAITARGTGRFVLDGSGLQSLDLAETMILRDTLDFLALNRCIAVLVDEDAKRRKFLKQCKIHLDFSLFEDSAAAVKFLQTS